MTTVWVRPYERLRIPQQPECAFIAGFFDGDGTIDVIRSNDGGAGWSLRIRFGQTRPAALRFLNSFYGHPIHERAPRGTNLQVVHSYEFAAKLMVRAFCEDSEPYVREKRDITQLALSLLSDERMHLPLAAVEADLARLEALRDANEGHVVIAPGQHGKRGRPYTQWMRIREPTMNEAAYIAGFFDAEGSLQPKAIRGRWWSIEARVSQVSPDGPSVLQEIFGSPVKFVREAGRRKPQYRWELTSKEGVACLVADILPYIHEKRPQLILARKAFESGITNYEDMRAMLEQIRVLNPKTRRPQPGQYLGQMPPVRP